jgi:hypothetical protein
MYIFTTDEKAFFRLGLGGVIGGNNHRWNFLGAKIDLFLFNFPMGAMAGFFFFSLCPMHPRLRFLFFNPQNFKMIFGDWCIMVWGRTAHSRHGGCHAAYLTPQGFLFNPTSPLATLGRLNRGSGYGISRPKKFFFFWRMLLLGMLVVWGGKFNYIVLAKYRNEWCHFMRLQRGLYDTRKGGRDK